MLHKCVAPTYQEVKVVVGLDFSTTHSRVAFAMVSRPNDISVSEWPTLGPKLCCCKTLMAIYKPANGSLVSWGHMAHADFEKDVRALDKSGGSNYSLTCAAIGSYFTELK